MLIFIWKYLQGYVVVKIYGYSPERFMNLCANRHLYIWKIQRRHECFIFCISKKGFLRLRPIARKTHCKVKIIKRVGLPFKLNIFKKRKFFLVGFFSSIFILMFLSIFIWKIEIIGNSRYTNEEIIKYLSENHIKVGILKNKMDCEKLDNKMLATFNNIQWVSSEIQGTKLVINIKEGLQNVDIEKENSPCDIVADKQGVITNIITRNGTPLVKKGDVILIGDVLVSGTLEMKELEQLKDVKFTSSDAEITIKTNYNYSDEINYKHSIKNYHSKTKKDRRLDILGLKINLFRTRINNNNYDKIDSYHQISLFSNFYLPIIISTTTYKEYDLIEEKYSYEESVKILKENLTNYLLDLSDKNIQVLEENVNFSKKSNSAVAQGIITVVEKVGEKRYFKEDIRRKDYDEYFRKNNQNTP